jgi:hypothetical protein
LARHCPAVNTAYFDNEPEAPTDCSQPVAPGWIHPRPHLNHDAGCTVRRLTGFLRRENTMSDSVPKKDNNAPKVAKNPKKAAPDEERLEDEEKIIAGRHDVNYPALLTKDVPGG